MKDEMKVNVNVQWLTMLGLIFVVLKLCSVISWSWVWVLLPFWIQIPILIVFIIILIVAKVIVEQKRKW